MIYLRSLSEEYLGDYQKCINKFPNADSTSVYGAEAFCTLYCPCNLNTTEVNIKIPNYYQGSAASMLQCNPCETIQTYKKPTQAVLINWINSTLGYNVTANSCAVTTDEYVNAYFTSTQQKYIPLMTWAERLFGCSGLCNAQKTMLFSDINSEVPDGACYKPLNSWTQ